MQLYICQTLNYDATITSSELIQTQKKNPTKSNTKTLIETCNGVFQIILGAYFNLESMYYRLTIGDCFTSSTTQYILQLVDILTHAVLSEAVGYLQM